MEAAYKFSNQQYRQELAQQGEEGQKVLAEVDEIEASDIVVVLGEYDNIEKVLAATEIPFIAVNRSQLPDVELNAGQTIFVNCPQSFTTKESEVLRKFVEDGGRLITTDHSLTHLHQQAFPGYIKYSGKSTGSETVEIEVVDASDSTVQGFLGDTGKPSWSMAGGSFPITIVDEEKVQVLLQSKQLGATYGESPVVVKFIVGDGVVYHMTSHFFLQRSDVTATTAEDQETVLDCGEDEGVDGGEEKADTAAPPRGIKARISSMKFKRSGRNNRNTNMNRRGQRMEEDRQESYLQERGAPRQQKASSINRAEVKAASASHQFILNQVVEHKRKHKKRIS